MPITPPTDAEYAAHEAAWMAESAAVLTTTVSQDTAGAVRVLQIVRDLLRGRLAAGSEAACIDQIRLLEDIKSAAAAAQVVATEEFRHRRDQAEADAGIKLEQRARGIGSEIGLARRVSPQQGSAAVRTAHTLTTDMPHALEALCDGRLSEYTSGLVVKETSHLDPAGKTAIDTHMEPRYGKTGSRRLAGEVRALAQQADPVAYIKAHALAKSARAVNIRPAPSGMAYLTALLPLGQAFACKKALHDTATSMAFSEETVQAGPTQLEADLLVQRLTGQSHAEAVNIEVQLVMTDETLLGTTTTTPSHAPVIDNTGRHAEDVFTSAWMPGYGPIPAALARDMLDPVHDHQTPARVFLRRVLTDPVTGEVTKIDTRKREFTGPLRRALVLRDQQCRTPWCNAPIAHLDHAHPYAKGGHTSAGNGTGLCARCNYTKENPGWHHTPTNTSTRNITTPTGHTYNSTPPPITPNLNRRI
ncbi:HNH endonuclease [Ancrocorticia populi]|uniref:HNH endonuclease n=1 Tax=Ancrocorticia populi TaxID=2175228 RepID=A0A2V1K554_9ACTO|nr:HNH endonuclease [Ancrocorticia populi]